MLRIDAPVRRFGIGSVLFLVFFASTLAGQSYETRSSVVSWAMPSAFGNAKLVVAADIDGNGIDDVVMALATPTIFAPTAMATAVLNPGTGAPAPTIPTAIFDTSDFPGSNRISRFIPADLNGDPFVDLFVQTTETLFVGPFRWFTAVADGFGGFFPPTPIVGPNTTETAGIVGDFDGDGDDDLCLVDAPSPSLSFVTIHRNPAASGLWPIASQFVYDPTNIFLATDSPTLPVAADFNGDGFDDLVFMDSTPAAYQVSVIWGSSGVVAAPTTVLIGNSLPPSVLLTDRPTMFAADITGDGFDDLVLTELNAASGMSPFIHVIPGGTSGFASTGFTTIVSGSAQPRSALDCADHDGDGVADLIAHRLDLAAGVTSTRIDFFRGQGNGTFAANPFAFNVATAPTRMVAGNFSVDGDRDLFGVGDVVNQFRQTFVGNLSVIGTGCSGALGVPRILFTMPSSSSTAWILAISNGRPFAGAAIMAGISTVPAATSCVVLDPATLIPGTTILLPLLDSLGSGAVSFNLAALPVGGLTVYLQGFVADPLGALTFSGANLSVTPGRAVTFLP